MTKNNFKIWCLVLVFFFCLITGIVPARYVLAVLGCLAFAIIYGLKVNLSVAIVGMVNHTATTNNKDEASHSQGECGSADNSTTTHEVLTSFLTYT